MKTKTVFALTFCVALAGFAPGANAEEKVAHAAPALERKHKRLKIEVTEPSVPRYPEYWHPVREEAKREPRATWAQDGYLFKYSF
jgi:hypothetical protein